LGRAGKSKLITLSSSGMSAAHNEGQRFELRRARTGRAHAIRADAQQGLRELKSRQRRIERNVPRPRAATSVTMSTCNGRGASLQFRRAQVTNCQSDRRTDAHRTRNGQEDCMVTCVWRARNLPMLILRAAGSICQADTGTQPIESSKSVEGESGGSACSTAI
jgi:hypothetical protein